MDETTKTIVTIVITTFVVVMTLIALSNFRINNWEIKKAIRVCEEKGGIDHFLYYTGSYNRVICSNSDIINFKK